MLRQSPPSPPQAPGVRQRNTPHRVEGQHAAHRPGPGGPELPTVLWPPLSVIFRDGLALRALPKGWWEATVSTPSLSLEDKGTSAGTPFPVLHSWTTLKGGEGLSPPEN